MNIYFHSFSHYAIATFNEIIRPALTAQQKKICIVVAMALGFLAACYLVSRYCFKVQPSKDRQDVQPDLEDKISLIFHSNEQQKTPSSAALEEQKILSPLKLDEKTENEAIDLKIECIRLDRMDGKSIDILSEKELILIFNQLNFIDWKNLLYLNKTFYHLCFNPNVITSLLERDCIPKISHNQEVIFQLIKRSGPLLKKLNLEQMDFSEEELKAIFSACPNLKWLKMSRNTTDEILKYLPRNLESLDLAWCNFTDKGLEHLKGLSALQSLDLSCCNQITDNGLEHLKVLSALQSLNLEHCYLITDDGLEHLKVLSALQSLNLSLCHLITNNGLEHLKALSTLQFLNLKNCNQITDGGLEHLKKLSALQSLNLKNCNQITDGGLEHLKVLSVLQSLNLYNCDQITDNGLEHLKGLSALQSLDLSHCDQITDDGLEHLKGLSALQSLSLEDCSRITDDGLEHLKVLSALQSLNLEDCSRITDNGLEHLKVLSALQSLNLYNCNEITDGGLEHLKVLSALQSLDLFNCNQITDNGLEHLKTLSALQSLDLSRCTKINRRNLQDFENTLPLCRVSA